MTDSISKTDFNPVPNAVTLRPVQPQDEAFLIAVYAASREQELALVAWTDEQRDAFVHAQFLAQTTHYQSHYPQAEHSIILFKEQPVGRLYLDRREHELRILDITLLSRHRGHGIGTPIIRGLMEEASQSGRSLSIYLDSLSRSQSLFERLGFRPTDATDFQVLFVWSDRAAPTESNHQAIG